MPSDVRSPALKGTLFIVLHIKWLFNQPAAGPRCSLKTLVLPVSRRAVGGEQSVKCPPVPRLRAPRSRAQDVVSVAVTAQVMSVDEKRPQGHRKTHQASRTHRDWHLWTQRDNQRKWNFFNAGLWFTREMDTLKIRGGIWEVCPAYLDKCYRVLRSKSLSYRGYY